MRVFKGSLDTASIGFVLLEFHGPLEWLSASRLSHYLGWGSAALVMLTTGISRALRGSSGHFATFCVPKCTVLLTSELLLSGKPGGRIFVPFDGAIYIGILRREVMVRVA